MNTIKKKHYDQGITTKHVLIVLLCSDMTTLYVVQKQLSSFLTSTSGMKHLISLKLFLCTFLQAMRTSNTILRIFFGACLTSSEKDYRIEFNKIKIPDTNRHTGHLHHSRSHLRHTGEWRSPAGYSQGCSGYHMLHSPHCCTLCAQSSHSQEV